MAAILGTLFLGITFLAHQIAAVPSEAETVISQLARTVFHGRGVLYLATIAATTLILMMAANTAFADFPRLSALLAGDGFLPRQLTYRGSRLVYSRGIVALAVIAALLILAFRASVTALIPLYAIGVFLSFTLSQAGMARRWWKIGHLAPGQEVQERARPCATSPAGSSSWRSTGSGPCHRRGHADLCHHQVSRGGLDRAAPAPGARAHLCRHSPALPRAGRQLSLDQQRSPPPARHCVILPISGVHRGTQAALRYARTLSADVTAVHVSLDSAEADRSASAGSCGARASAW